MIALYPVRPGEHNDELVFSLRSLTNLPEVDEVWTVGYRPAWLTPDRHIDGNLCQTGQANVYDNVRRGCEAAADHDELVVMNDDFIVTATVDRVEPLYRSTIAEHIDLPTLRGRVDWWPVSLRTTLICLQAHAVPEPLSYELHVPFRCAPTRMADILDTYRHVTPDNPPQWRSLYGNTVRLEAERATDVKVYGRGDPITRPYLSTTDENIHAYFVKLRDMFPTPSRWETP